MNLFREQRAKEHPRTPDVTRKCGKRAFDGLITKWRRELHKYDPSVPAEDQPDDIADLGECMFVHDSFVAVDSHSDHDACILLFVQRRY